MKSQHPANGDRLEHLSVISVDDSPKSLSGMEIYQIVLDRYVSNQSGSQDLGFNMYQDLVISQVLRQAGVDIERGECLISKALLPISQNVHHAYALLVDGRLIGPNGESGWEEIIENCKRSGRFGDCELQANVSWIDANKDKEAIQTLDKSVRDAILHWIASEVAFVERLSLEGDTAAAARIYAPRRI